MVQIKPSAHISTRVNLHRQEACNTHVHTCALRLDRTWQRHSKLILKLHVPFASVCWVCDILLAIVPCIGALLYSDNAQLIPGTQHATSDTEIVLYASQTAEEDVVNEVSPDAVVPCASAAGDTCSLASCSLSALLCRFFLAPLPLGFSAASVPF